MDPLRVKPIVELNPDTVLSLKKQYDLDKPGRLEDSINILIEWLKKQDHFERKEFSKDYLEKTIIISKGSVEKAKSKLDKTCTYRTLLPQFFDPFDVKKCNLLDYLSSSLLPKMTKDHYRIFLMKTLINNYESGFMDFYKYAVMICEYIQAHDYCNGIIAVFDYREANLVEILKAVNLVDLRQAMSIVIEGYGMRLKGLHFITPSKMIDTLIAVFKQAINPKLAQRIQVHKDVESLFKYVPKEILPIEYGGEEQSIKILSDKLKNTLSSEEFTNYFNELRKARTNETFRSDEKFNDQCLGMPGSFRKLAVD